MTDLIFGAFLGVLQFVGEILRMQGKLPAHRGGILILLCLSLRMNRPTLAFKRSSVERSDFQRQAP